MSTDLIGYARVSTLEQNPQLQTDALSTAGCQRTFTDTASGTTTERPQLSACLDHLRAGDTLVVWRLDRLGRSLPHLLALICQLEAREVAFRSLTEAIDTITAGGRLVFSLFGALADFEAQLISERSKSGLAAAGARGRLPGRPAVMSTQRLDVARQMHADGYSMGSIASTLSVGRSTLYRHLRGPGVLPGL